MAPSWQAEIPFELSSSLRAEILSLSSAHNLFGACSGPSRANRQQQGKVGRTLAAETPEFTCIRHDSPSEPPIGGSGGSNKNVRRMAEGVAPTWSLQRLLTPAAPPPPQSKLQDAEDQVAELTQQLKSVRMQKAPPLPPCFPSPCFATVQTD